MSEQNETLENQRPDIQTTVEALAQSVEGPIPSTVFYGLANLSSDELAQLEPVWQSLDPAYRRKVMDRLVDVSEANFELDYSTIGNYALDDAGAGVRDAAVELLFEDNSVELMDRLIDMALWDEAPRVRAAAAIALGRFIQAGEFEELPERHATRAQDAMVTVWSNDNEDIEVRRRALEAISNSTHEIVEEAIRDAYQSYEHSLQVSAIYAMGRSADQKWAPTVIRELDSDDDEKIFEAARAAGELTIEEAVPGLVRLANETDREIAEVAIWSLGEIGGRDVMRTLDMMGRRAEEVGDTELLEVIEDALASASLAEIELGGDWDD